MTATTEKQQADQKQLKGGLLGAIESVADTFIEIFRNFKYKKDAAELVRQAEELVVDLNIPVYNVLYEVNKRANNPLVGEAVLKLRAGKPRYVAYNHIFPEEVIKLLKVAEMASLPPNKVIVEYSQIKEKIDENFDRVKKKIRQTVIMFLIFWGLGKFVFGTLTKNQIQVGKVNVTAMINGYLPFFYFLLVIPFLFFLFFGVKSTAEKFNPIMRKIFNYFNALKLLSIFSIASEIGLKSNKILDIYSELDEDLDKHIKRLPQTERNAIGIGKILRKFLTDIESVLLIKAIQLGRVEGYIKKIARKRLKSIDETTDDILEGFNKYSSMLHFIPLVFIVFVFMKFMFIVMNGVFSNSF